MKVLDARIIIKVIKDSKKAYTKLGDFEIPEDTSGYDKAEVIALGPEVKGEIKVGDTVYVYHDCGKEFSVSGEKYRTITSSEVIVVI